MTARWAVRAALTDERRARRRMSPGRGMGMKSPSFPHREARINKNLSGAGGRKSQGAPKPSTPSGRNQRGGAWGIARSDGTSRLCEFPGARLCEFPMPQATIEIPGKYERISAITAEILLLLCTSNELHIDSNGPRAALGLRGVGGNAFSPCRP